MVSPSQRVPEAHHYVPRFYLKGFAHQKELWVYQKGKPPRPSRPKDEAQRDNYYTIQDSGGQPTVAIERLFSKIESVVAPTFRRIANPQFTMSSREVEELFSFVALTFVRVPSFRDYTNRICEEWLKTTMQRNAVDPAKFAAECKEMEIKSGKSLGDLEQLRSAILKGDWDITQKSSAFNLESVLRSGKRISDILLNEYRHDIWYASNGSHFLTCDNPVVTIGPDSNGTAFVGMGFGRKDVEVIFPLNKRACLNLKRRGAESKIEVPKKIVEQTNRLMMHVADQYVFGGVGHKRTARLFDQYGSKLRYGVNAFVPKYPTPIK
jgi:hypothetical protein